VACCPPPDLLQEARRTKAITIGTAIRVIGKSPFQEYTKSASMPLSLPRNETRWARPVGIRLGSECARTPLAKIREPSDDTAGISGSEGGGRPNPRSFGATRRRAPRWQEPCGRARYSCNRGNDRSGILGQLCGGKRVTCRVSRSHSWHRKPCDGC